MSKNWLPLICGILTARYPTIQSNATAIFTTTPNVPSNTTTTITTFRNVTSSTISSTKVTGDWRKIITDEYSQANELMIPAGRPATLHCEVLKRISALGRRNDVEDIFWLKRNELGVNFLKPPSSHPPIYHRDYYVTQNGNLHMRTVTQKMTAWYDCVVKLYYEHHTYHRSRVNLLVQNCSNEWEWSSPCKYGKCRLDTNQSREVLLCECVLEYTGEFCGIPHDKLIQKAVISLGPITTWLVVPLLLWVAYIYSPNFGRTAQQTAQLMTELSSVEDTDDNVKSSVTANLHPHQRSTSIRHHNHHPNDSPV